MKHRLFVPALCWLSLVGAQSGEGEKTRYQHQAAQTDVTPQSDRATAAIEEQPGPPSPDAGCSKGKDDRHSDLCAQWKAADAAQDAARWGWWQLVIAGVGLILGAITMAAAIAAAVFAKRAAVATEDTVALGRNAADGAEAALAIAERNADAAAAQVSVATETAKRQLRAYVTASTVVIKVWREGDLVKIALSTTLNNSGSTPAHLSMHRSEFHCTSANSAFENHDRRVISPGSKAMLSSEFGFGARDVESLENVYARCHFQYVDYLGEAHLEKSFWTAARVAVRHGSALNYELVCHSQDDEASIATV